MSNWKLLLDQNIRYEVKQLLLECGYDVVHTVDLGLQRSDDPQILSEAIKQQRTVITLDKDFGSLNIFPLPLNHYGVIRIKTELALPANILKLLQPFLENHQQQDVLSSLVILSNNKSRISNTSKS